MNLGEINTAALLLLQCLEERLTANAPAIPVPEIISLRPGTLVGGQLSTTQDECRCGVAWVRVTGLDVGDGDDAQRTAGGVLCGPAFWLLSLEMGVLRCWNMGDAHTIPTPAQLNADAAVQFADAQAMAQAVLCCAEALGFNDIGEYTPNGPEGLCLGGTMTVTLQLDSCADC